MIAKRNTVQIRDTDQHFSGTIEEIGKGKRKLDSLHTDPDGDKDAFVTVSVGNSSLNIKKAKELRDDLVVPLDPQQLQVVFDLLIQSETCPTWCTHSMSVSDMQMQFTMD